VTTSSAVKVAVLDSYSFKYIVTKMARLNNEGDGDDAGEDTVTVSKSVPTKKRIGISAPSMKVPSSDPSPTLTPSV
jgi:hypothetical protein